MVIAVLLAGALWRSSPVMPAAATLVAFRFPLPTLLAAFAWGGWCRLSNDDRPGPDDEAVLLDRLVGELEGGASPRAALLAVSSSSSVIDLGAARRRIDAGMPARDIAGALEGALPRNGRLAAAAWALAGEAGAPAGPVMAALARRAAERGRLERERRASTAQARATAWVVAGLPIGVIAALAVTGRLGSGPAVPVVAIGLLLQAVGLGAIVAMVRGRR